MGGSLIRRHHAADERDEIVQRLEGLLGGWGYARKGRPRVPNNSCVVCDAVMFSRE